MNATATGFMDRLDAARDRLARHAELGAGAGRLTAADPASGERWEEGQVWAHLAEFIPYWLGEATTVLDAWDRRQATPFGRTKVDSGRVAAIERDRRTERAVLWQRAQGHMETLRAFLPAVPEASWAARGVHPTRGEMTVAQLVDEFLVGHLEEHAEQLDRLRA